jgi:succinate dehydrogenase/fumarate reductase flavoprotein subunit
LESNINWDVHTEVVVVGFGAAGAVAAITIHDAGPEVIIIEKQTEQSHLTTSHMSAGVFIGVNNASAAAAYMEQINIVNDHLRWTDTATSRVWAEYASQNREWIEHLGGRVKLIKKGGEHHHVAGYESIELYGFPGLGRGLMRFFKRQVADRKIEVQYRTRAIRLITDLEGKVLGVRAQQNGKTLNLRASRAVVMAPGGFEFNEEMKLNYLKVYPTYFAGSPANTGDGYSMVQAVGGSLWHMNCCSASWVIKVPDFLIGLGPDFKGVKRFNRFLTNTAVGKDCAYIITDKHGKRYTNEEFKRHTVYYEMALYDSQKLDFPRVPSYWIFDSQRMNAGPLPFMFYGPMLFRLYSWSKDNREEIEKGWIVQGATPLELAVKLKMKASVLEKTFEDFNHYCQQEEDTEFNRPPQHLIALDRPPFYAIELWPGSANTQGGPRRNHRAQIVNDAGEPIPRLYAAGEFGSVYGMLYPASGGNLAECIVFGRLAGENAAREPALA